ncbi:hypothetical protein CEXT_177471 [Caerostris extrusa]|uniref:Uncharacterized protein n=1 Tax=Caerostris extrusa TaxID=172846 RepID=A0AAV4XT97_CAEEX|nr:hypothetical protein CEXT_177471 [Caerostris extrusa]
MTIPTCLRYLFLSLRQYEASDQYMYPEAHLFAVVFVPVTGKMTSAAKLKGGGKPLSMESVKWVVLAALPSLCMSQANLILKGEVHTVR